MCQREDFWAYASPEQCHCDHLKFEVGRLLLGNNQEHFKALVDRTFTEGGPWKLQRYYDFFSAIEAWANYAYHHHGKRIYKWQDTLLNIVEQSGAPVLPIVEQVDEDAMDTAVNVARPLVRGRHGQQRGDGDRIYLRIPRDVSSTAMGLPEAVQNQGTYVTLFRPPGTRDIAGHGLLEFSRPEILAQLQPGNNEQQHRELLKAALYLACQKPVAGGVESVMSRAETTSGGPAWRLSLDRGSTLRRAAQNLRSLHVPTTSGWQPANKVARAGCPWPKLDEDTLQTIIGEVSTDSLDESLIVERFCRLFGIGVVPIDEDGAIPDWPLQPSVELAQSLLGRWSQDIHPMFLASLGDKAREQLLRSAWLHAELSDDPTFLGGSLEEGLGPGAPYAPIDLWWQSYQSGFRTRLLPRLSVEQSQGLPDWVKDMGVENPRETMTWDRISRALNRLHHDPRAMEDERDLSDLYRRLIEGVLRLDPFPAEDAEVPLLCRHIDPDGGMRGLEWGCAGQGIWHDPGGTHSSALSAFHDVRIWVYRGASRSAAETLGLIHFEPDGHDIQTEEPSNQELAAQLKERLWEALPDLLAAASAAREDFDEPTSIRRQAELEVLHYQRVWVCWYFRDRTAEFGHDNVGNVVLLPQDGGARAIGFDGEDLPLVECAFPLCELLCDSRAFGSLFRDGLYAWSRAGAHNGIASSVARFRRDHNLTEADIDQWRARLQAARLDDEQKADWCQRVQQVLSRYGDLAGDFEPGRLVTPETWRHFPFGNNPTNITENEVRMQLHDALADDARLLHLIPRVDFRSVHRQRFLGESRLRYIAAAADRTEHGRWNEALLEELTAKGNEPMTREEEAQLGYLHFDVDRVLRVRYGLPTEGDLNPSDEALVFAEGKIPITALPPANAPVELRPFHIQAAPAAARAAISEEAWLAKSRRQATGGRRAEDAVLTLAIREALVWKNASPDAFEQAANTVLTLLGETDRTRYNEVRDEESMGKFLHVSNCLGNVGFDVLVPDSQSQRFLLVEIKRVGSLDEDAAFFMSENERQMALWYQQEGVPWRLWLVSSTGRVADVSHVTQTFQAHHGNVQTLLDAGLRPGEWMLVVRPG